MSANTKIIVLKSKELIYTGIFIVLGALLILLLFYMFSGDKEKTDNPENKQTAEEIAALTTYQPGIYSSTLNLGGSELSVQVTVDKDTVSHVDITNLDEAVTVMYPLLTPCLDEINTQLPLVGSLDSVTYANDNQYTTLILLDAIKRAVEPAIVTP